MTMTPEYALALAVAKCNRPSDIVALPSEMEVQVARAIIGALPSGFTVGASSIRGGIVIDPGLRPVLMSDELFEALGAEAVAWGEPSPAGFYTPMVKGRFVVTPDVEAETEEKPKRRHRRTRAVIEAERAAMAEANKPQPEEPQPRSLAHSPRALSPLRQSVTPNEVDAILPSPDEEPDGPLPA